MYGGNNQNPGFMGYNNNLLRGHNTFNRNNVPFQNNPMLMNNPGFTSAMNNYMFQQKLHMAKMEQINRARRVDNMNVSENDLINYVICPIKVEKMQEQEFHRDLTDREGGYVIDKKSKDKGNKVIREWWAGRTNQPYKNIMKKENYKKKFRKKEDLIVHKVTDEDKIGLMEEFDKLEKILKEHDDQLKLVYSKSEKLKHKKKFMYNNVYKYRLKHNPKDYSELKDFYKKEQKKIDKEQKKVDNLLNLLMDGDILDDEEKKSLQKQLDIIEKQNAKAKNVTMDDAVEKELKKLKKDLGPKEYKKFLEEIEKEEARDRKARKKAKKREKEQKEEARETRKADKARRKKYGLDSDGEEVSKKSSRRKKKSASDKKVKVIKVKKGTDNDSTDKKGKTKTVKAVKVSKSHSDRDKKAKNEEKSERSGDSKRSKIKISVKPKVIKKDNEKTKKGSKDKPKNKDSSEKKEVGQIDDDVMAKYLNRKKK